MPFILRLMLIGSLASLALWGALWALLRWRGVTVFWRTMFGPALVFDSEDDGGEPVRLLNVGGTFQTIRYIDPEIRCELVCEYHRTMAGHVLELAKTRPDLRILVLGGGGMAFPAWLAAHLERARIDVVEIDGKVIGIAREHFWLDELEKLAGERLHIICADGWEHLKAGDDCYDLIVCDAFGGSKPLGPMGGAEGAAAVRSRLAEGGLFLANLRSPLEGKGAQALEATLSAYREAFLSVELIEERPEEPGRLQNNVLVAG